MIPSLSLSDAINVRSLDDLKALFGLVPYMIDQIIVDVITSLDAQYDFEVTDHAIQKDFASYARIAKPFTLTINGIFVNDIENITAKNLGKSFLAGNFKMRSWKQKKKTLEELMTKNKVISVVTPHQKYKSLMITNINFYEGTTLDACFFSISLKEVKIKVEQWEKTDPWDIPAELEEERDEDTENKTKGKKSKGKQQPIRLDETTIYGSDGYQTSGDSWDIIF